MAEAEAQGTPGPRGRGRWLTWPAAAVVWALVVYLADRGPIWPGVLCLVVGQAGQLWAAGMLPLKKNHGLATGGPYAWVRNPMYLGRFLVGLGLALLTWRWYLVAAYALAFAAYAHQRVLREEKRLHERFGEEYLAYCRRVRRWLPLWPRPEGPRASWSAASARKYGQLVVALALAPFVVTVVIRRTFW